MKSLRIILLLLSCLCVEVNTFLFAQPSTPLMSAQDYIRKYGDLAIQKMKTYKIPASIILGQGLLESANGNSDLAVHANNHFGIKCHKDWSGDTYLKDDDQKGECFRKYKSAGESYDDHSIFLSGRDRYAALFRLDPLDYKAWARGLKEAGYATNPNYAAMLIKVIEDNRLYELDKGVLPLAGPPSSKTKSGKAKTGNDSFDPVSLGGPGREVMLNNDVEFVYTRPGDDYESLSKALNIMPWQIRRYNDISKDHKFVPGEIVYLKSKKRKAQAEYHLVTKGETMRDISQRYAVKLKLLYRRNHMEPGTQPRTGDKLYLRSSKP